MRITIRWRPLCCIALLASAAHADAAAYVTGTAYSPGSDRILYTENYSADSATATRVQYESTNGKLLAEKQLDFSRDKHAPNVVRKDFRLDSVLTITTENNTTLVQAQRDGEATLAATIEVEDKLVIDAGFDPFVQDQWSALIARDEVTFRFLVPARKTAVKLKLKHRDCDTAGDRVCFRIKAANWIIAAVMAPIDLEYEKHSQRLMRFTGLGQLPDSEGKGQKVDIHYRYPESVPAQ